MMFVFLAFLFVCSSSTSLPDPQIVTTITVTTWGSSTWLSASATSPFPRPPPFPSDLISTTKPGNHTDPPSGSVEFDEEPPFKKLSEGVFVAMIGIGVLMCIIICLSCLANLYLYQALTATNGRVVKPVQAPA